MTRLRKDDRLLLVSAPKVGFVFRSEARRKNWSVSEPLFKGRMVHHFTSVPRDCESLYAARPSERWGLDIQRSDDRGLTSTEVEPLHRQESGGRWNPGRGGLILHSIVPDVHDKMKMHVAISAAGVFYTEDGGRSWQPRNRGTRADFLPDKHPDLGQCVHKLLPAADGKRLYQQNQCGVYRSDSSAERWTDVSKDLSSRSGFFMGTQRKDAATVWVVPITSSEFRVVPDGKLTVFDSRDVGPSWQRAAKGLPDRAAAGAARNDVGGFGPSGGSLQRNFHRPDFSHAR
jgi:hypothetical protein